MIAERENTYIALTEEEEKDLLKILIEIARSIKPDLFDSDDEMIKFVDG